MKQLGATLVALSFGFGSAFAQTAEAPDAKLNPVSAEIEIADPVWAGSNYDIHYVVNPGKLASTFELANHPADDLRPRLDIAENGDSWVVWWRDVPTPQVLVRHHDYSSDSWTAEAALGDAGTPGHNPEVAHDGTQAWVAFEARESAETVIRVGAIEDSPDPFGVFDPIGSTTYDGALDVQIQSKSGQLWVTWIDSASEVAWCRYDYAAGLWSLPAYEDYASQGLRQVSLLIETIVLGQ